MKKVYIVLIAFVFSLNLSAEEFLNEPFSTWLPNGWTVIEGSGSTSYSHWWHRDEQVACVFVTNDNQDEWLITPELVLPDAGELRLSCDMMGSFYRMVTMDYGDIFVNVSTDDGASWETIWVEDDQEIVEASGVPWPWQHNTWFFPSINMNDYAGQTIKIAFRYVSPDGDADWWNVDNVVVKSLMENEVVLEEFDFAEYAMVDDEFSFSGSFRNLGENDVTSFEVTYSVNGIESQVYLVDGVAIPYNTTYVFTHDVPYTFTDPEIYDIQLQIVKVNGVEDPVPGNNVIYRDISIASTVVDRKPLFEVFTSSTCAPCAGVNEHFDGVLSNIPDSTYSLVKYQVNWPGNGDPYYIEDNGIRVDFYGIGSVPRMVTNGFETFSAGSFSQTNFNQATAEDAYVSVELDYTFDGLNVSAFLDVEPKINIADASVHFVVVEKTTYNNTGSNGETEFHNVVMTMMPDGFGTVSELEHEVVSSYIAGTNLITTFIEEFDDLMLVAWVQDNETKAILQSESCDLDITTGINNHETQSLFSVFPNPTTGVVSVTGVEGADLEVCDLNGRMVYSLSGEEKISMMDLTKLKRGVYFVRIIRDTRLVSVEKLVLN